MPDRGLQSHPPRKSGGGGQQPCPPGFIRNRQGKCVQDLSKVPKSNIANLPVGSPDRGFFLGGKKVSQRDFERLKDVPVESEEAKRVRKLELKKPQITETLEKAGAFEDVGAREIDLTAPRSIVGELPFVGSSIQAIGAALGQARILKPFKGEKGVTGETAFPEPDDGTLREAALRQIRIDSFNEGISIGESMGTLIEGIPFLSTAATKYASGLIEDPSSNVDNINSEISKHAQRATNLREKATSGALNPGFVLEEIRKIEVRLSELEGRLKLLINTSPILQENTDKVNLIESNILDAFDRTAAARGEAAPALAGKLSGTGRVVPSDEQLFFELKEGRK